MKKLRIIICLFVVIHVLYGCKEEDLSGDLLKPWNAPVVKLTDDATIGAYYNLSFNDNQWINIDPLYLPTLGKYNSRNTDVIKQHLDWSTQAGIDFWICDHSQEADSIILHVFPNVTGIENIKLAMSLNLSLLPGVGNSINLTDSSGIQAVVSAFKIMRPLFNLSNYLKIDSKPVVVLQDVYNYGPQPNYLAGATTDERVDAISGLRALLKDSTGYEYYFIGNYINFFPPDRYPDYVVSFDALSTRMITNTKAVTNSLNENIDVAYEHWKSYLDDHSIPFIPSVFPAFNDTTDQGRGNDVILRNEVFFSDGCNIAKKYLDENVRLILINSFNNWREGTQIEPANTYGEVYMNIVKNEFKVEN